MDAATLLIKLRERSSATSLSRDPLSEARAFLRTRKHTPEGAALHKFLRSFISGGDTFQEADLDLVGHRSWPLMASLIRAYLHQRYEPKEWHRALFY